MDVDLLGSNADALDQTGKEDTLACCGQLRPILADFRGARDEPALRRRIGTLRQRVDAAGIEKPLAHAAGHELLDLFGWDPQPGGPVAAVFSDQRAGGIVAVARALLDRVGWCHRVAAAINQHAGEQARLARSGAGVVLRGVPGELGLSRSPQRLVDDRRVFAGVGLSFVDDLPEIGAVLQDQVERAARERLAASDAVRSARPRLAFDPSDVKLLLQRPHRTEVGIAAEDGANGFRLAVDDHELAVLYPIPERRHPAHPHALPLRRGDLVADSLADDLALELRKG